MKTPTLPRNFFQLGHSIFVIVLDLKGISKDCQNLSVKSFLKSGYEMELFTDVIIGKDYHVKDDGAIYCVGGSYDGLSKLIDIYCSVRKVYSSFRITIKDPHLTDNCIQKGIIDAISNKHGSRCGKKTAGAEIYRVTSLDGDRFIMELLPCSNTN